MPQRNGQHSFKSRHNPNFLIPDKVKKKKMQRRIKFLSTLPLRTLRRHEYVVIMQFHFVPLYANGVTQINQEQSQEGFMCF